jgi:hypothetical protein|tara:strand:- start:683 stop:1639 length:957 start_codon:yes stop_codon:yes gene_type:complete
MGFFGRVRTGAFLGGLAEDMKENRKYTREKKDKIKEYLTQRGIERRQEVNKFRDLLERSVDYLQSKDLDDRSINAMLIDNPREVLRLAKAAQAAEEEGRLTSSILKQAVEVASDFEGADLNPSELIKKATPYFVKGDMGERPEQVEQNLLQKMFGEKSSQDIMYDAYSESIFGDVTGADVFASMSASPVKGRKEDSRTKVDLGLLSGGDRELLTDARDQIYKSYDTWIENEMQDLLAKKADASNEEIENQIDQNYQELLKIQREYSSDPYQYYYQLMLVHPDIAQNWFNTRPTYRAALSNTAYFPDGTAELFQGDEQE